MLPGLLYANVVNPAAGRANISGNGPGWATRAQLETSGDPAQVAANTTLGSGILADLATGSTPDVPAQTYTDTYGVCGWRYDSLGADPFGRV